MSGGSSTDHTVAADPNTTVLIAAIQADDPTVPISVEIIDPNGISVIAPVATPGVAVATLVPTTPGNYTVRVRNAGVTATTTHTQLITRSPLALLP